MAGESDVAWLVGATDCTMRRRGGIPFLKEHVHVCSSMTAHTDMPVRPMPGDSFASARG